MEPLQIRDGLVVSLNYKLTRADGTFVEAVVGDPPFVYLHGAGNVVPGLERELAGRVAGDRLYVTVPPELGYGPYRSDFVRRLSRREFPPHADVRPGLRFGSHVHDAVLPARVTEIDGDHVVVCFNHPLAGETLHFAVDILDVRPARLAERALGRPLRICDIDS